ncbi:OmpA family protein [Aliikangiella coralliicola]|uniref:OmpA family protein n=1 Tax=Aliikangiella coralliicola TaxID=2592383 RepID=A0A545UB33_9GAMM|nr:OmpA family protein [Aliikangiella coralliicola]TQV86684.1 OmpA family protein [Aliikangiella coralliicola]
MKIIISMAILASSITSFSANSSDEGTGPFISLGQNYFSFDGDRKLEDENDFYLGLGYQVDENWGVELRFTEVETNNDFGSELDINLWSVSSLYRYSPRGTSSFFWKAGAGRYESTPNTADSTAFRLGLGYDFNISKNFSWVVGADTVFAIQHSHADFVPYTGFEFFFGDTSSRKPTPPPQPTPAPVQQTITKDTDRDGVNDDVDRCPSTPAGAKVDSNGCELDSDKDGVVDSADNCPSTPAGAKVDEKGCRIALQENVSIQLNVKFANNSDAITNDFSQEISKVATFMRQYPDTTVVIEGHTDSRGAASYNQSLSQKRAEAVRNYLISEFNIDSQRVSAVGKGESSPIADNETAEGRAANRRVQAEIKTTVTKFEK